MGFVSRFAKLSRMGVLLISVAAVAQIPDGPKPNLTRTDKVLLVGLSALNGVDAYLTNRSVGREENPLARPFVTHGTALSASYFAFMTAVDWFGVRELNKRGHRKLSRALTIGMIGAETICIVRSAPGPRKRFVPLNGGLHSTVPWRPM